MKNIDYIKSMNAKELADYINSVYIAGVLEGKGKFKEENKEDYIEWLNKEHVE